VPAPSPSRSAVLDSACAGLIAEQCFGLGRAVLLVHLLSLAEADKLIMRHLPSPMVVGNAAKSYAQKVQSGAVFACVAGLCQGFAGGYVGLGGATVAMRVVKSIMSIILPRHRRVKRSSGQRPPPAALSSSSTTIAGRWEFDASTSDSLEPFLVAVGAPKMVARMVGNKGKPITMSVEDKLLTASSSSAGGRQLQSFSVTVAVDGKEAEVFDTCDATSVQTPRGIVTATLEEGATPSDFTVLKRGPREGELVTERRRLSSDDGRELECVFTHQLGGGTSSSPVIRVVRRYRRADE
jgi:hypothetical protein